MTMMRARHVLGACVALAGVALAIAVRADAPADQYAFYQAQTPTIKDTHAKLEWERFPEQNLLVAGDAGADGGMWAPSQSYANAIARCTALGNGWRLPTVKELLTIIDEDPHKVYRDGGTPWLYIDRNAFPTAEPQRYWSSSPVAGTLTAWTVDFQTGETSPDAPQSPNLNRCVRVLP